MTGVREQGTGSRTSGQLYTGDQPSLLNCFGTSAARAVSRERFHNLCAIAIVLQGGLYFHPALEDLSTGTPVGEKAT